MMFVTVVHGNEDVAETRVGDREEALRWIRRQEEERHGGQCPLLDDGEQFTLDNELGFQFGTGYHWAAAETRS
jgi:hypothetical protein